MKRKNKQINSELRLVGINSAGLSSKLASFDKMLKDLQPGIFFVEETKLKRQGKIKTEHSEKYVIFELVRKEKGGGGLVIGVVKELNPTWISEGDDEVEILTMQINPKDFSIRCVGGSGQQENIKFRL